MSWRHVILALLVFAAASVACGGAAVRPKPVRPERARDAAWWEGSPYRPVRRPEYRGVKRTSTYLTMRDGVRLAADLYLPRGLEPGTRIPAIVIQTRYVRRMQYRFPFSVFLRGRFHKTIRYFVRRGYAWVYVDARGSGASFGSRDHPYSAAEQEDGREIVDWVVAQPWSSGKVGAWGNSYTGGTALFLAATGHPAVQAIMPRFAMFDMYAEAVFPGGVHLRWLTDTWSRLARALDRGALDEFLGPKVKVAVRGSEPVKGKHRRKVLRAAVAEHGVNGSIRDLVEGITFRDDASPRLPGLTIDGISPHARLDDLNASPAVAYLFTGWFDASFVLSEIHLFLNLDDPRTRLTIGPWDHGLYNNISPYAGRHRPRFDSDAESVRFFDRRLLDLPNGLDEEARVHYFTMGEERWKTADTWPPRGGEDQVLYLGPEHGLRRALPGEGVDVYPIDPAAGTGDHSRWVSLVNVEHEPIEYEDRAAADARLVVYDTPPLPADLEVTGHPRVVLYVAADAADAGVFVYLEDVAPDGRVEYVTEGMLRALHRKTTGAPYRSPVPYRSFTRADGAPLVPGEPAILEIALYPTSYLFKAGHAIRLAIAGADVDHFAPVEPSPTALRIHRGDARPSRIVLPTMPRRSTP
jgi:putative CocE/NonD family hydrolase